MGSVTNGYNQNQFPMMNGYGQQLYPQPQPMQNQPWNQPQMVQQSFPQMPQQPVGLVGRIVQNPNDIRPNEVAMDGSITYFPMSDQSCILAKRWKSDGTIETFRFVPEEVASVDCKDEGIKDQLDRIEHMLKQRNNYRKPYNKEKEKVESNGN